LYCTFAVWPFLLWLCKDILWGNVRFWETTEEMSQDTSNLFYGIIMDFRLQPFLPVLMVIIHVIDQTCDSVACNHLGCNNSSCVGVSCSSTCSPTRKFSSSLSWVLASEECNLREIIYLQIPYLYVYLHVFIY
jgi:hypothetical protein